MTTDTKRRVGHPQKFTDEQKITAGKLFDSGKTLKQISAEMGVSLPNALYLEYAGRKLLGTRPPVRPQKAHRQRGESGEKSERTKDYFSATDYINGYNDGRELKSLDKRERVTLLLSGILIGQVLLITVPAIIEYLF